MSTTHVVILEQPMPGVRNTTFGFDSEDAACVFQNKLDVGSRIEPVGQEWEIIPTITEVFASLRAAADGLRMIRLDHDLTTKPNLDAAITEMLTTISNLGDYDEPLVNSINAIAHLIDLRGAEDHEAKTVEFLQHLTSTE